MARALPPKTSSEGTYTGARPAAPPKTRTGFLVVNHKPQELVVLSQVEWWITHWDVQERKSRKCGGDRCLLCSLGFPQVLRVVLMVLTPDNTHKLFELRERHRSIWEHMIAMGGPVGCTIRVKKEGMAKNSALFVHVVQRDLMRVAEASISNLVGSLGLPAQYVAEGEVDGQALLDAHEEDLNALAGSLGLENGSSEGGSSGPTVRDQVEALLANPTQSEEIRKEDAGKGRKEGIRVTLEDRISPEELEAHRLKKEKRLATRQAA